MNDASTADDGPVKLSGNYRFQWEEAQQAYVLLYPEGMVTLNGPAGEILKRCDGTLTASQLVETLKQEFPGNDGLEDDVRGFLVDARERGWIRGG